MKLFLAAFVVLVAVLLPVESREPVRAATAEESVMTAPLAVTVQTGTASWYGLGSGVAVQWCTWTLRHTQGCGMLAIQSHDTGITVVAPVIDWCECHRGTPHERIVDLQLGVVAALGLDPARGLYTVTTWPVDAVGLPDTAMEAP